MALHATFDFIVKENGKIWRKNYVSFTLLTSRSGSFSADSSGIAFMILNELFSTIPQPVSACNRSGSSLKANNVRQDK